MKTGLIFPEDREVTKDQMISEITWELEILSAGADNFVVSETQ